MKKINESKISRFSNPLVARMISAAIIATILVPLWSLFDYFIDPANFTLFLILRLSCIFIIVAHF
jgi:hypothetical protein